MKPYFAKYLPVEGEVKEGDKVFYSGGELNFPKGVYDVKDSYKERCSVYKDGSDVGIKWYKGTYTKEDGKTVTQSAYLKIGYNIFLGKDLKKVKLFLCSRDIQIGDKVSYQMEGFGIAEGVFESIGEEEGIRYYNIVGKDSIYIYYVDSPEVNPISEHPFKVIGEISPDALPYVKEEDEFDEDQWRSVMDDIDGIYVDKEKNIPLSEGYFIQIKCPWGHFH